MHRLSIDELLHEDAYCSYLMTWLPRRRGGISVVCSRESLRWEQRLIREGGYKFITTVMSPWRLGHIFQG